MMVLYLKAQVTSAQPALMAAALGLVGPFTGKWKGDSLPKMPFFSQNPPKGAVR
jgi:hypothetical protein